ncbi:hypothetical protein AA0111_g11295 [Alternaria arborescens]|uniref:hypothetical protein n=1 Tax=Alternaria arborescens TaxID=156630 RepID=UPI0010754FF5|nr:hypothetical protein AA0111_g11295 [Alternaria arborescens]RYO16618.1 hypothetical protein AA0111_g11295 [Alternaria arborescens]
MLKYTIRRQMIKLAVYEQIIARPSNTIENECTSIIKARQQILQATLKANQKRYTNMVVMSPMKHLPQYYHVPAISISELSRFTSTEVKAFEDVTTIHLSLVQLTVNRAALEQEIRNIRSKERRQTEPVKWIDAVEDANEIQDIKSIIKECGDTMREHESWIMSLRLNAWAATNAANRVAKSDVGMPRISTRSPSPAPAAIAATPLSAPTPATTACDIVIFEPVKIASVQVAVADIPPEVKAAAKDIKARKASNVVATVPKSTTAITKVEKTLSSITLCAARKQYANVKNVERTKFVVGDIGWFPILRPSVSKSSSDIYTEFGNICAKSYPLIIVETLEDCMLGLVISTSNGNGLRLKCDAVKSRSALLVSETSRNSTFSDWGQELIPRKMLRVKCSSEYSPAAGAYVDMLNVIMIPYDTRFQKKGYLIMEDVLVLQRMRLSAVLAASGAGKLGSIPNFWQWLGRWYQKWCKAA